jgi:hypothetical protein
LSTLSWRESSVLEKWKKVDCWILWENGRCNQISGADRSPTTKSSALSEVGNLMELTVSWEDRIMGAYEQKQNKYQDLVTDREGWMESIVTSCGGGMSRLRGTVNVEGSAGHW